VFWSHEAEYILPPRQNAWSRSGDLLYAYDPHRDLHGYRCVGPETQWTLWLYGPDSQVAKVWRASSPLVPYARLAAAILLVCATVVVARRARRDHIEALPWQEAKRGADGVLRLGEAVVQTPTGDDAVAKADTVCVMVADAQENGTYRTGATVTALHTRVGSRDQLQQAQRRAHRVSTVAVVALTAASVAASAWLIVLSLRQ